jgi:hypothetical protein
MNKMVGCRWLDRLKMRTTTCRVIARPTTLLGLRQREIARACSISQRAINNYLKKSAAARFTWPLPEGWDEKRIEEALFGEQRPVDRSRERAVPDFPSLQELQRHRHLTLLAWEEYRQTNPQGKRAAPI